MHSEATVKIIGHVGKVEIKSNGNTKFATLSVATNERWTDKATGEVKERTDWHRAVTFALGKVALVEAHIRKGDYIAIDGKLRTRSFEHNGETRYTVEVEIVRIGFLSPKDAADDGEE